MDTLDYSGDGWNGGSKVVMACCGSPIRTLTNEVPKDFSLSSDFPSWNISIPGILFIQSKPWTHQEVANKEMEGLAESLKRFDLSGLPLVVVCDSASFAAQTLNNFLWVTFTRANPSHDIFGVDAFTEYKHWGCRGSLIIDARIKTHHAPALVTDDVVSERVDRLFKKGGELHGII